MPDGRQLGQARSVDDHRAAALPAVSGDERIPPETSRPTMLASFSINHGSR